MVTVVEAREINGRFSNEVEKKKKMHGRGRSGDRGATATPFSQFSFGFEPATQSTRKNS
jgi:hypothetical protein